MTTPDPILTALRAAYPGLDWSESTDCTNAGGIVRVYRGWRKGGPWLITLTTYPCSALMEATCAGTLTWSAGAVDIGPTAAVAAAIQAWRDAASAGLRDLDAATTSPTTQEPT